jgi:hypothetical protein
MKHTAVLVFIATLLPMQGPLQAQTSPPVATAQQVTHTETHSFLLPFMTPTGEKYWVGFPVELRYPGTLTGKVSCKNEINMPEGRSLVEHPLHALIHFEDYNKQLSSMGVKYFTDQATVSYDVTAYDLQRGKIFHVKVSNRNARVRADCTLTITFAQTVDRQQLQRNLPVEPVRKQLPLERRLP